MSAERLEVARDWIDRHQQVLQLLSGESRTIAALALLICDDNGHVSEAELASALMDSRAVSAANRLISGAIH